MEKLRLFIAIDIDKEGIEKIIPFQEELSKKLKEVRWTKENTWHITLKFLGDVDVLKLEKITKTLMPLVEQFRPFYVELEKIDVFPDIRIPRVIFLDTKENETLINLAKSVEEVLIPLGFPKEGRDFKGHLTLGRIKDTKRFILVNPKYKEILSGSLPHKFYVPEFYLYKSELGKEGPKYTKLKTFQLK